MAAAPVARVTLQRHRRAEGQNGQRPAFPTTRSHGTPAFSQLQPTRRPQGSRSAGFTMMEVLRIALIAQKR
ncbi:hypothetical protein E4U61_003955 [Claviceps capensis]|nr:hypothetical protein E4U61_003955 [Claviceps capensis]